MRKKKYYKNYRKKKQKKSKNPLLKILLLALCSALALAPEQIAQADYRMVSDVRCIYVETAEDDWGYVQRYWVSVDTGLLVVAERLQKGETVYRMAALEADQTAPPAETFTLPDGTDLLHR